MEYSFNPETNLLTNNYGTIVAKVELAANSNWDEYNYFYDWETGELMHSQHENVSCNDVGRLLVESFVAFNS